jgi:hypothetical protein
VPTRPLGWFSNNHPSNQSLGARPGARNPADEAGAVDEPGWHAGEEVEEAVAAVLAAFAGAPGRVAGEANLVVLRGVVDDALARGCRPDRLVEAAAHDYTGSRSAPAVLVARIRSLSPTPPPDSSPPEAVAADLERVRVLARNWAGCVPCEEIVDEALKRLSGLTAEDVRTVVDEVLADVPG